MRLTGRDATRQGWTVEETAWEWPGWLAGWLAGWFIVVTRKASRTAPRGLKGASGCGRRRKGDGRVGNFHASTCAHDEGILSFVHTYLGI